MVANITETKRKLDIVLCIDGTGSMVPYIDSVKKNAVKFKSDLVRELTDMHSDIDSMRIKTIVFRDYEEDGDEAMQESMFFELPQDEADFVKYMDGITANGGGDAPENGLEALYYAMKSDFIATGDKDRQVIVLFTDTDALDLGERKACSGYPADMVDENGLVETWACVKQEKGLKLRDKTKRLVMFAPSGTKYEQLKPRLERSVFQAVSYDAGLGDIDFGDIIKIIAASVASA